MSFDAFSRRRVPIGGAPVVLPASVRGGVDVAVRRPDRDAEGVPDRARAPNTSSYRTSPGRMARPAASALVQPSGRRRFESRGKTAPEPASPGAGRRARGDAARVPRLEEEAVVAVDDEHVLVAADAGVPRVAPLDPLRLRLRLHGDRVARRAGPGRPSSLSSA